MFNAMCTTSEHVDYHLVPRNLTEKVKFVEYFSLGMKQYACLVRAGKPGKLRRQFAATTKFLS